MTSPAPAQERPWQDIVAAKRAARDEAVYKYLHTEPAAGTHEDVTGLVDVAVLVRLLETGTLSAEQVVRAYIQRYLHSASGGVRRLLWLTLRQGV